MGERPVSHTADMFLLVKTARAGAIKGEAIASKHEGEISVHGWRWGMSSNSDAASRGGGQGGVATRRAFRQLIVDKAMDRATTSLMSVLASNDKVKSLVLSFRAAGGEQLDYFTITLTDALLVDIDYMGDATGTTTERLTFVFKHVTADYRIQEATGQLGGGTTFDADV
jgi:type VI secretion system secreted protein Hcp